MTKSIFSKPLFFRSFKWDFFFLYIGLLDDDAHKDITEMRSLLEAWRDTRKGIWNTIVKLLTVGTLTFIAGAVWMTLK